MANLKPLVKHLQVTGGKTGEALGKSFGRAFDAAMEFLRDRRIVAWELVGERIVFVRGRGKRLTRVSKTVRDRLIVTMPKADAIKFLPTNVPDRRAGGRRR